jgi:hypothetical protein
LGAAWLQLVSFSLAALPIHASAPHQAKYIAHDLTLQHAGGGLDCLSQRLFKASVDLNPHQIEAAMFALRSPDA